jgi:signal transduction histidine kinase
MPLFRALRLLGYALCLVTAAPEIVGWITDGESRHGPYWLAFYAVLVLGFHLGAAVPPEEGGGRRSWIALGVQEASMVALALAAPCQFAALALVVTALQAALFLPPKALAITLAAQTVVVSGLVMGGCGAWESISWLLAMAGFQLAVAVAVMLARRENVARAQLAQANVELRAARALLTEATRAQERNRIARELHDALGHNLTALGLHLELARSVAPEKAPPLVAKACLLADEALADVRAAVGVMRSASAPDVGRTLRALCADTPGLDVHLEMPEPFVVECSDRAHCLVRCVQEILTNTLRHAGAKNLWIRLERTASLLTVDARDDGRGAPEVRAGNGLSGMRERLEEMGGRLAVTAAPAFSVSARLPIQDAAS